MIGKTFAEKLFSLYSGQAVKAGDIVFAEPDLILSHDNSASIMETFKKMGGIDAKYPDRLVIVLDHDAPPTSAKIANDHQRIREFVVDQKINNFYDVGNGICHQLMSNHALPSMLIVGSDSHTCTSGAFSAFAAGIDRTETAGLWLTGKTWFRVPETIKIELQGKFSPGVYAKDLALWIMSIITSSGATYQAVEFHGGGVKTISISERMTLTNLAAEMGAKTAIFPPDEILFDWFKEKHPSLDLPPKEVLLWSDDNAKYSREIVVNLEELEPLVALPHQVDNIQLIANINEIPIQQAFLGTCTNARLDDLTIAASILKNNKVKREVQFLVAPASKEIYLEAMKEGVIQTLVESGATILSCSCGPCLGKGQGIPSDECTILSTANRNFLGRMGNKTSSIFLASPATIAASAISGKIVDPRPYLPNKIERKASHLEIPAKSEKQKIIEIAPGENRYKNSVWNYRDVDDFNTDQMFSGALTYDIKSSEGKKIVPHLFKGLDESFGSRVKEEDIIIAGENFGCGSSREHPSVGLAYVGVQAIIAKSVSRIFYRSAINQGLPIIVHPQFVENFNENEDTSVNLENGQITNGDQVYAFPKLPDELLKIFNAGGLIKYYQQQYSKINKK